MGNKEDIINFIKQKNILNKKILDFSQIYWLLNDKVFYKQLINTLKQKGLYNNIIWSFCFYHKDFETYKEFVQYEKNLLELPFDNLKTEFFTIEVFKLKEYFPLINPRAHSVGSSKVNIFNSEFRKTYLNFLNYIFEKKYLENTDKLILTNYLIVQDRIEEANNIFKKIDVNGNEELRTKIQYDYTETYLDFILGYPDFKIAKKNCENYLNFPILKWRNLFIEIANQLAEFEEKDLVYDMLNKTQEKNEKEKITEKTSHFSAELKNKKMKLTFNNNCNFIINCYQIDLEVLFSIDPFKTNENKNFSFVKPFKTSRLEFKSGKEFKTEDIEIDMNIKKNNTLIQITQIIKNMSQSQYIEYIPCNFDYFINEEKGIIKIIDLETKLPLSKVYVKIFGKIKNSENIIFYKDGYTDLRGSFDYLSLNKEKLNNIGKFSGLIVSKKFGCKIVYFKPPVSLGVEVIKAKKIISKNWNMKQKIMKKKMKSKYVYEEEE